MANSVSEGTIEKSFKKIKADFFLEEGRLYYRTEEETEDIKHDLVQELQFFDGKFCSLAISSEVKNDELPKDEE